jgi:hypothetical protein
MSRYLTATDGPNKQGARPQDKWQDEVEAAIKEKMFGSDGNYGALLDPKGWVTIRQAPDSKGGVPNLTIQVITSDTGVRTATLSGDEVFAMADKYRAKRAARTKTPEGSVLRGRMPRDRLKGIYEEPGASAPTD